MTQEVLKQMYQLLLTEPHAPTVCAQLERIAREALADHAIREVQRLGQEIEQEPVAWLLTDKNINSLQVDDIQRLIDRLKHAHHTDLCVRINGQDEWVEADWLKHMVRATPPQRTEQEPVIDGNTSDGYHTFNELYEFRKAYNIALFNEWAANGKCSVHKSWRHDDGELCFGGGWFIVVAILPQGQISNHYEAKDWDLFHIQETGKALFEFDGHTGADVIERLKSYTTPAQRTEQEPAGWEVGVVDGVVTRRLAPPQRTWVGLTDKDWNRSKHNYDFQKGADWAESILKEKNT